MPELTPDLGECQAKKVKVNPRDIPGSMLEFVEHCTRQKPPKPGIGAAKDWHWHCGRVNANAGELLFRPTPPYDVIEPPAGACPAIRNMGRGYVRWNCYHGLPHDEIKEECQPGCTQCRISLNLRYGYARSP